MITAVVGANWGDEGKGKMTDLLSENVHVFNTILLTIATRLYVRSLELTLLTTESLFSLTYITPFSPLPNRMAATILLLLL